MTIPSSGAIRMGANIGVELGNTATSQISLGAALPRILAGVPSGAILVAADFYSKSMSISDITWPSNLSGGNFNTLGSSRVILNGHYLTDGGTVTTTWTMKAFPSVARSTAITMYFNGWPMTRNVDGTISFGTAYYWGAYNPNAYSDNRTFCGSQSNFPQNTDSQVSGMAYYALSGTAGGGRTVFTNGPSGFTVAASISGNDITCTITNNTGQDQFLYAWPTNSNSTRTIWYWGWYYSGEYQFSQFDYSNNRGTWNLQSSDTYGVPLYSYIQVTLNGTTYNISKPHQSAATQANIISDIKSALESALSGAGVTVTNITNGLKIYSTAGVPTINYTYYFPDGNAFVSGTDPSYYGSSNFTPTLS